MCLVEEKSGRDLPRGVLSPYHTADPYSLAQRAEYGTRAHCAGKVRRGIAPNAEKLIRAFALIVA